MFCSKTQEEIAYTTQKDMLKALLDALFQKYSPLLEGNEAKAMIDTWRKGSAMIDEIDFLIFPSAIVATQLAEDRKKNYLTLTAAYNTVNSLIQKLCALDGAITQEAIDAIRKEKNQFVNDLRSTSGCNSIMDRILHGLSAFTWGLVVLVGLAVGVGAFVSSFTGATIPIVGIGFFAAGLGGTKMVYGAKNANDSAQKSLVAFAEAIDVFVKDRLSSTAALDSTATNTSTSTVLSKR